MNKVILFGRLGRDPESKVSANGTTIANFTLATNERWTDKDGRQQEKTEWHRIVVFGPQGDNCVKYLAKGRQALLEGKISTREWETDEGEKRYTTEVVANRVQFISDGSKGEQPQQPRKQQPKKQPKPQQELYNDDASDDLPF